MVWTRSPLFRFAAALLAVVLAGALVSWALRASGHRLAVSGFMVALVVWLTLAAVIAGRYWRGIDEAAREAQKWAWYWGGQAGLCVAGVVLALNPLLGLLDRVIPAAASPTLLLAYGAGLVMLAQVVGFHIAWAYWWWTRR